MYVIIDIVSIYNPGVWNFKIIISKPFSTDPRIVSIDVIFLDAILYFS